MAPRPTLDSARTDRKASRVPHRLAYLVVCAFVLTLYLAGGLEFAERKIEDVKFGLVDRPATGNLVLVEIDAHSLSELGVWPWPRRLYAKALDALVAAGATRVAFDVDFSAYSGNVDDALFAAALAAADGKVILPVFRQRATSRISDGAIVDAMPAPAFMPHAALAHLNVLPSDDGRVREIDSTASIGAGTVASLGVLLAGPARFDLPVIEIDYGINPATVPRLSFVDVIGGRFAPEDVAGKQIIIGSTAAELGDILAVPRFGALPGPLLHVLAYESVVQGRALQRLSEPPVAVLVILAVLCLGWLFERLSLWWALFATSLATAGMAALPFLVQAAVPVQVDMAPLLLAVLLSFVAAMANRLDQQSLRLFFQGIDIRRNDVMMRNLVEKSIVGVFVCDEQGRIESANAAAASMFGYAGADLAGASITQVFSDNLPDDETGETAIRRLAEAGQREGWGLRANGARFPVEVTANAFTSDGRASIVAFVSDISLRREQEEELQYRADHDGLTGLPNRVSFTRELAAALAEAKETRMMVAVFLLDLDRFKDVNDTLGHATGDKLLQDVAERLSKRIPDGAMLSRFGGDEFAMYLPNIIDLDEVERFAGEIINGLRSPFDVDQVSLDVGGSLGYALFPANGETAELLLQRADIAMYSAKRFQSGVSKYWAEDDAHSVRNLTLTGDLRRAIEQDELNLVFQPKIDLESGAVLGAEVLCRWNRPEHGPVPPDEFIGHAEQSGLIFPLTRWVLGNAVKTAAIWRELGWDMNIAVNLSARLLHHEEILSLVTGVLEQWAFPPERLTLEITENALLVNPAHAMIVISEFSALGVKVSIDDFGTGYSSLSYLTTLPASELKIDKSFVLGMARDDSFKTVVKSVITMAHELNLSVVAEGIETEDAAAMLRSFGCDVGQGYLFGKPLAADAFEALLKTWQPRERSDETALRHA